ncbi:MAG: hypothetical protein RLZZ324_908 [Candidatus Parcubacteria bacterium]|jgi:phenylalanyl-tRNA synthetase beta chain
MNILASYNWIKEHVALKESAEDFAREVSLCGPGVERLYPQAPLYEHMVVGQIVSVNAHPNPKVTKLRIATVDVGSEKMDFVCGGSNLEPGMKVAVALIGAQVKWHGQGEPITLQEAEIQGVKSRGMICGANEIGLAEAFPHAEREILDLTWCKAKPGTALAKALDLEDTVMDIEVTTNRPDAFSMIGLAREASAILGGKFLFKEGVVPSLAKSVKPMLLSTKISASKLCTRYQAVVMTGICADQSPWWVKKRLIMSGIRPINAVVDITNYVMLELGQPMHAFDYDKIAGHSLAAREAREGEKLKALDGKTYDLKPGQLVIADANGPVAIAGVMGGEDSGVTDKTTTIIFESATFNEVSVRRTARALNLHSDSSLRYEKGLPEDLTAAALARAVELCQKIACGKVASTVQDVRPAPARKVKYAFRPAKAEALIGVAIPRAEMLSILKSLGFGVSGTGKSVNVTVPYWRAHDIEGERDLIEEIARVHGYHNLPSVMPVGEIPVRPVDAMIAAEDHAKHFFRAAGFTELVTYSMTSADTLAKAGRDPKDCLRINNPLSSDFEFMRRNLIPGVLEIIKQNEGLFPSARVFEVSRVYIPRTGDLPQERTRVVAAVYGPQSEGAALLAEAKGLLEAYCPTVGAGFAELDRAPIAERPLWHPGRSAEINIAGSAVGVLGEIHPLVLKKFGIDGRVAVLSFDLTSLKEQCHVSRQYVPVPLFPASKRDIAVVVDKRLEYAALVREVRAAAHALGSVEFLSAYDGKGIPDGKKSVALHLEFSAADRTLTSEEVEGEVAAVFGALKEKLGAEARA